MYGVEIYRNLELRKGCDHTRRIGSKSINEGGEKKNKVILPEIILQEVGRNELDKVEIFI